MENYLRRVVIKGLFEENNDYDINFIQGCNCIYGDNGTGKTSIINLIVNSFSLDLEGLDKIPFESITLYLAKSGQRRANKVFSVYKSRRLLSNKSYSGSLIYDFFDDEPISFMVYRNLEVFDESRVEQLEKISLIRDRIEKELTLTHVPLLRVHDSEFVSSPEQDEYLQIALRRRKISSKQIAEIVDPSLRIISSIQEQFIEEVNQRRKKITSSLEILKSKIIEKVMIDQKLVKETNKAFQHISKAIYSTAAEINPTDYFKKLKDANIDVPETKVTEHFQVWRDLTERCKRDFKVVEKIKNNNSDEDSINKAQKDFDASYFSLFSITHFYDRFLSIVNDVEKMQDEKIQILKIFTDYENEINKYLNDRKHFSINEDGRFRVTSNIRVIKLSDLSSGEKHIITILGRAALSKSIGSVFVADEPELSLHLDWQRMILPSLQKLSPLSQIIVATHSPAITAIGAEEIDLAECRK